MKNTSNYAPPRKGFAHGEKTRDAGTTNYWLKMQDGNTITQHDFQAESEDQAGDIALALCSLENKPSEWTFVHECSRHRGYEIEIEGSIIHLFHIL